MQVQLLASPDDIETHKRKTGKTIHISTHAFIHTPFLFIPFFKYFTP